MQLKKRKKKKMLKGDEQEKKIMETSQPKEIMVYGFKKKCASVEAGEKL